MNSTSLDWLKQLVAKGQWNQYLPCYALHLPHVNNNLKEPISFFYLIKFKTALGALATEDYDCLSLVAVCPRRLLFS